MQFNDIINMTKKSGKFCCILFEKVFSFNPLKKLNINVLMWFRKVCIKLDLIPFLPQMLWPVFAQSKFKKMIILN